MKNLLVLLILALFNLSLFSQVVENEEIVKYQDKNEQEVFQAIKSWAESNSGSLINDKFSFMGLISSIDDSRMSLGFKCIISPIYRKTCPGVLNVTVKVSVREGRYKIDIKNPEYQILQRKRVDIVYEKTSEYLSELITSLKSEISETDDSW
tara:strand:+ start:409 stop:864 length:456 start_codon:yes stop_codon:yes gene_type:complete